MSVKERKGVPIRAVVIGVFIIVVLLLFQIVALEGFLGAR